MAQTMSDRQILDALLSPTEVNFHEDDLLRGRDLFNAIQVRLGEVLEAVRAVDEAARYLSEATEKINKARFAYNRLMRQINAPGGMPDGDNKAGAVYNDEYP